MLAPALRWHVADGALNDFEKRLLHAFARDVARDADVLCLAADLIDLVDVNDADLSAGDIVIRGLKEAQDDVFDVFADVAGLRERGGVRDAEGDVQNACEGLGEECFAATGGADEQDVALFELHIAGGEGGGDFAAAFRSAVFRGELLSVEDALVVIVHGHAEHFFGMRLSDDMLVQQRHDVRRARDEQAGRARLSFLAVFPVEDVFADVDAVVANVHARPRDEFAHLRMAFAAEGTEGNVGAACHGFWRVANHRTREDGASRHALAFYEPDVALFIFLIASGERARGTRSLREDESLLHGEFIELFGFHGLRGTGFVDERKLRWIVFAGKIAPVGDSEAGNDRAVRNGLRRQKPRARHEAAQGVEMRAAQFQRPKSTQGREVQQRALARIGGEATSRPAEAVFGLLQAQGFVFHGRKRLRGHPGGEKGRQAVFSEACREHAPGLHPPAGLVADGFERGMIRRKCVR